MPQDHTRQIAEQILAAFEEGRVPEALANVFLYRICKVDIPSQTWSLRNRLIAMLSGHPDARGFRQWLEVDRHVRAGQRAFYILVPMTYKAKEDQPERGIEAGDTIIRGFKGAPVFGYDQTEGAELPYREQVLELPDLPLLEVAQSWGLSVSAAPLHLEGALGRYRMRQRIELAVANLLTWAHELVHAADDRLGQLFTTSTVSREVVAEFGGSVLLETLGFSVESDRGRAFRYITYYAEKERRSAYDVASELLDRVCACVDLILTTAEALKERSAKSLAAA